MAQSSLIPQPLDPTEERREYTLVVNSLDFDASVFNIKTGTKIFALKAQRVLCCSVFRTRPRMYTVKNPTWDGTALRIMRYDVATHEHVDLVFVCPLNLTPSVDAIYHMPERSTLDE